MNAMPTPIRVHSRVIFQAWEDAADWIDDVSEVNGNDDLMPFARNVRVRLGLRPGIEPPLSRYAIDDFDPEHWQVWIEADAAGFRGDGELVSVHLGDLSMEDGPTFSCRACNPNAPCSHVLGMVTAAGGLLEDREIPVSLDGSLLIEAIDELHDFEVDGLWWLRDDSIAGTPPAGLTVERVLASVAPLDAPSSFQRRAALVIERNPDWTVTRRMLERTSNGGWRIWPQWPSFGTEGGTEELDWINRMSAILEPRMSIQRMSGVQWSLVLAAGADGRVVDASCRPMHVGEAPLPIGRWEMLQTGAMEFLALPEHAQWLTRDQSAWWEPAGEDRDGEAIHVVPTAARRLLREAIHWPPVNQEQLFDVAVLWTRKPALAALAAPAMPELEDVQLKVEPKVSISYPRYPDPEGMLVQLELLAGDLSFSPSGETQARVPMGTKRYCFDRPTNVLPALDGLMGSMGFRAYGDGRWFAETWSDAPPWVAYRIRQAVGALVTFEAPGQLPLTTNPDDIADIQIDIEALPAKGGMHTRFVLQSTCNGFELELASLIKSPVVPAYLTPESIRGAYVPFEDVPGRTVSLLTDLVRSDAKRKVRFATRVPEQLPPWLPKLAVLIKQQAEDGALSGAHLVNLRNAPFLSPRGKALVEERLKEIEAIAAAKLDKEAVAEDLLPGTTLPEFQRQGVNWLLTCRRMGYGAVLADDRGMGKTVQAIGALVAATRGRGRKHRPSLIVVDPKELGHWSRHLAEFCPRLKTCVHYGKSRERDPAALAKYDVILTTYMLFMQAHELHMQLQPQWVFLDEARSVKNPTSVRWQKAHAHTRHGVVVPITGTPMDRSFMDLWALVELAAPGLAGDRKEFKRICEEAAATGDPDLVEARDELMERIKPFVLMRNKKQVGVFTQKETLDQLITMEGPSQAKYEAVRARVADQVIDAFARLPRHQARIAARNYAQTLRRYCGDPGTHAAGTTKGDYLVEMVKELRESDHTVLVFTHDNSAVTRMQDRFNRVGIANCAFYGGLTIPKREKEKALFVDGHVHVMILSTLGASGLDLPQADTVIITDPWINLAEEDQMGDRAHRYVSTKDVTVFNLILEGTIEEVGKKILERSQQASGDIFEGTATPAAQLKLTDADYEDMLGLEAGTLS